MNCPLDKECNRWQTNSDDGIDQCFYYGKLSRIDALLISTYGCDRFRVSEKGGIVNAP